MKNAKSRISPRHIQFHPSSRGIIGTSLMRLCFWPMLPLDNAERAQKCPRADFGRRRHGHLVGPQRGDTRDIISGCCRRATLARKDGTTEPARKRMALRNRHKRSYDRISRIRCRTFMSCLVIWSSRCPVADGTLGAAPRKCPDVNLMPKVTLFICQKVDLVPKVTFLCSQKGAR
jgi:hypothetical protein